MHHPLNPRSYNDDKIVFHVECLAWAIKRAPEGLPVRGVKAEFRRIKARAEAPTP